MEIDKLIKRISDIESDLSRISRTNVLKTSDGIMVGAFGAFMALCIAEDEWPRWIPFVGLAALMGKVCHILYKLRKVNREYDSVRDKIASDLTALRKACRELAAKAETEHIISQRNVEQPQQPVGQPQQPVVQSPKPGELPQNISSIIAPLQRLENTSVDFGDKLHAIVRKEIDRVLRAYKLEFLEYTEETKECYDTEEADIDEISYATLAVVKKNRSIDDRESPIILRGKVFIPKK